VAPLTTDQIAQFKRTGYIVLPGVIDPDLCRQARDQMWETVAEGRPSMKRDDPSTWVPFTDDEKAGYERPDVGGDPYFSGGGHRMIIRNGAEDLLLDIGARAVWDIAEQMLGKGEVVWPGGVDESGCTSGPCFMTKKIADGMEVHMGPKREEWTGKGSGETEYLRLPKTGPHWMTAQGTRGMYCTLPNSPVSTPPDWRGAHAGEGLYNTRQLLQTAVYFDDVPPGAGGLMLFPGSHTRIWNYWEAKNHGATAIANGEDSPRFVGYTDPPIGDIKDDTEPVMTAGPAGSVVLWHTIMLHLAGWNETSDIIRQATLYGFQKTPEIWSDERLAAGPKGDIWTDWSDEVRAVEV
jgi:hypothetical protein